MKSVFIGIPTLNRPALVRETIQSVLNQTYANFKVVVSDNVSGGNAADSIEEFLRGLNDSRFTFHRQSVNEGEYGQGRYLIREAAGHDFFMMLHDDDVLNLDYLEKAIVALERNPSAAYFVANPFLMNEEGTFSTEDTKAYLASHGRTGREEGEFDVLSMHLRNGFTPISGTLFRTAALEDSGFVDEDCHGNYPFECDVFLLLGGRDARGWFSPEELLGFRFHPGSMRNYMGLMENRTVVERLIFLFSRTRFSGANERRRKVILSRLYRAKSLHALRGGDTGVCRDYIVRALRENVLSPKAWALAPLILFMPRPLKRLLPDSPEYRESPRLPTGHG